MESLHIAGTYAIILKGSAPVVKYIIKTRARFLKGSEYGGSYVAGWGFEEILFPQETTWVRIEVNFTGPIKRSGVLIRFVPVSGES